MLLNKTVFLA